MNIKILLSLLLIGLIGCSEVNGPEILDKQPEQSIDDLKAIIDSNTDLIADLDQTIAFLNESLESNDESLVAFLEDRIILLEDTIKQSEMMVFDALARLASLELLISFDISKCYKYDHNILFLNDSSVFFWYKELGFALLLDGSYVITDKHKCKGKDKHHD